MTNLEQTIIEKLHRLPPEKQQQVLDYADRIGEAASEPVESVKTTWEIIQEIVEEIPKDEWDKLPTDGSMNVDHYLYGHPKKQSR